MDINYLWLLVLCISTPVAGVVGFAIQLRQIKKSQLENEKLLLEIQELKEKNKLSQQRIVPATTEEILHISYPDTPMFKRVSTKDHALKPANKCFRKRIINVLFGVAKFVVVVYFTFDLYRFLQWVISWST